MIASKNIAPNAEELDRFENRLSELGSERRNLEAEIHKGRIHKTAQDIFYEFPIGCFEPTHGSFLINTREIRSGDSLAALTTSVVGFPDIVADYSQWRDLLPAWVDFMEGLEVEDIFLAPLRTIDGDFPTNRKNNWIAGVFPKYRFRHDRAS